LEAVFNIWGLPRGIKVDNGVPLGDPSREFVPPIALWLTGLGIGMIWNRARTPQDNAKVERMQGVTAKWSMAKQCKGIESLRKNLHEACRFQREEYPTRVCNGSTRITAFPKLATPGRPYRKEFFDFQKVKEFLAKGMWERKTSQTGQVDFANQRFTIGRKHAGKSVYIEYLMDTHQWSFKDSHGNTLRLVPADFNSESIQDLTAFRSKKAS
jgi:transposase InsO family protein